MQTAKSLSALKKKLPKHYGSLIASKMVGVNPRQIHSVFNARTTDPDFVLRVISAAKEVVKEQQKINREIKQLIKSK